MVDRPQEVLGAVVDEQVDVQLDAAADLVVRALQVVVGQADLLQPARGGVAGVRVAVAGDVDEVTVVVPAPDGLDRVGVGLAGEDRRLTVGLLDAEVQLVGPQARDAPVQLLLLGQVDAEAAQCGGRQPVPVVVQRGVDVDGDAHARRAGRLRASSVRLSRPAVGGWMGWPWRRAGKCLDLVPFAGTKRVEAPT